MPSSAQGSVTICVIVEYCKRSIEAGKMSADEVAKILEKNGFSNEEIDAVFGREMDSSKEKYPEYINKDFSEEEKEIIFIFVADNFNHAGTDPAEIGDFLYLIDHGGREGVYSRGSLDGFGAHYKVNISGLSREFIEEIKNTIIEQNGKINVSAIGRAFVRLGAFPQRSGTDSLLHDFSALGGDSGRKKYTNGGMYAKAASTRETDGLGLDVISETGRREGDKFGTDGIAEEELPEEIVSDYIRANYKPTEKVEKGINVNDGAYGFTGEILEGNKTIETRNVLKNGRGPLDSLIGKRVAIIQTGRGKARVVGYVTISGKKVYDDAESFYADTNKHLVNEKSSFWRQSTACEHRPKETARGGRHAQP